MKFSIAVLFATISFLLIRTGPVADAADIGAFLSFLQQLVGKKQGFDANTKRITSTTTTKRPSSTSAAIECGVSKYSHGDAFQPKPWPSYSGPARINEAPWLVRIVDATNYRWTCDGTIITPRFVLTTASCIDLTRHYIVVTGDHTIGQLEQGEASIAISKVILHPSYDKVTKRNNFAILVMQEAAPVVALTAGTVCLPEVGNSHHNGSQFLSIIGWAYHGGVIRTPDLQKESRANLPVKLLSECRQLYQGSHISVEAMCLGNGAGCVADLGGPLTELLNNGHHRLVGIATVTGQSCNAQSQQPTVFEPITSVVPWITAVHKELFESSPLPSAPSVTSRPVPPSTPSTTRTTRTTSTLSTRGLLPTLLQVPVTKSTTTSSNHNGADNNNYNYLSAPDCGITKYDELANRVTLRIVGGSDAKVHQVPWQVRINARGTFCGGTIINKRVIMTAAHCISVKSPFMFHVVAGDHTRSEKEGGEQVIEIAKVIVHEGYDADSDNNCNDFALLITSKNISFASWAVKPACLPSRKSETYADWNGTISGWGRYTVHLTDSSDVLKIATVTVNTQAKCADAYRSKHWYQSNIDITNEMFCASAPKRDTCQGDSGGPLTVFDNGRHTLIGVTSFGKSCASPEYPGVYARVTSALDWLEKKFSENGLLAKRL